MKQRQCTAHSSRTKLPCQAYAIKGGTVCRTHGGSIKHVKQSAADRLAEMVEPALVELRRLIDRADSDSVKLAAVKDALDRAGYKPVEKTQQTGKVVIEVVTSHPDDLS